MSSEGSGSDTVRLLMDSGAQTETGTEGGAGEASSGGGGPTAPANSSSTSVKKNKRPASSGDFVMIKIVARIALQLISRFWAFSSAAVLSIVLFYWLCGGLFAFCLMIFACTGLLYHAGDKLLYHPDQPENARILVPSPAMVGLDAFESVYIKSKDRTRIHMFFIKPRSNLTEQQACVQDSPATVLFFHGNAGNIGHRVLCVKSLVDQLNCNVCLLEYRGYGHSDGSPCERGLYLDAQAALDAVRARPDVDPSKIVVFGRSLGGAVAVDLCSRAENRDKVAALMVENSFTSIPEISRVLFNFKLVRMIPLWFHKNKYDSRWKCKRVATPTLFLSGTGDQLVPPKMMTELFNTCGSDTKLLAKFPGGSHNETWNCRHYLNTIQYFLEEVVRLHGRPVGGPIGSSVERIRPPPTIVSRNVHEVIV